MTIPIQLRNLAADPDIAGMIPRSFPALEVFAACTPKAREIAGHDDPDRHDYLKALPLYLAALPKSITLALDIIKMDASASLGLPGLAADHKVLSDAQAKLAEAEAAVAEAEALQGQRLARIARLEATITAARTELSAWSIDYAGEIEHAEKLILQHIGKGYPIPGPFQTIAEMNIMKRLAPKATSDIKARIEIAEKELAALATA